MPPSSVTMSLPVCSLSLTPAFPWLFPLSFPSLLPGVVPVLLPVPVPLPVPSPLPFPSPEPSLSVSFLSIFSGSLYSLVVPNIFFKSTVSLS